MIDLPPPAQISIERSLGKGERAEVFLAGRFAIKRYLTQDQIPLPAKELIPYLYDENGLFLGAQRELDVAQRLRHPNVIRIHSMFFDGTTTYLVMDFIEGQRLDQVDIPAQDKMLMRQAARDVIDVLRLAAQNDLVHHDLHTENFILDNQGKIYFIDLDSFETPEGDQDWEEYGDSVLHIVNYLLEYPNLPLRPRFSTKEALFEYLDQI